MGENIGRAKASKLIAWEKDLIRWQKEREKLQQKSRTSDAKVAIPHFPKADWCPASCIVLCLPWKTKLLTPFFPYPSFNAERDTIWCRLTSWPGGAPSVLAVSPSSILPIPRQPWERSVVGNKRALVLCKHSSAAAETAVCYQHLFSHRSKTQHHADCHHNES